MEGRGAAVPQRAASGLRRHLLRQPPHGPSRKEGHHAHGRPLRHPAQPPVAIHRPCAGRGILREPGRALPGAARARQHPCHRRRDDPRMGYALLHPRQEDGPHPALAHVSGLKPRHPDQLPQPARRHPLPELDRGGPGFAVHPQRTARARASRHRKQPAARPQADRLAQHGRRRHRLAAYGDPRAHPRRLPRHQHAVHHRPAPDPQPFLGRAGQ